MNYTAHKEAIDRAKQAKEALRCCRLCPRLCSVDRTAGEKGYCRLDDSVRCFREMLFWGEEDELTPSHQIYFSGCNLRCEFCTVAEWNEEPWMAEEMNLDNLSRKIAHRRNAEGARTLNLLGGEPMVNLHGLIKLLAQLDPTTKVVLNSNMYYDSLAEELMRGLADIYLADLKCGNAGCAEALLKAGDYVEIAKRNILSARDHAEVIVRHVVLPGHTDCCLRPILTWLAKEIPEVKLSLRGDYVPPAEAGSAPAEYMKREDMHSAIDLAENMGLNLVK